ncbi:MAG: thiamine-phosphate kinase [Candidatus Omnitrophica bacterium]|nr:thiamine-phosphate kinase [Candidatus Omnitrophota bacterium]
MKKKRKPHSIGSLGEFGLIESVRSSFKGHPDLVCGPGDDCAVIKRDSRRYDLLTCDMLVEGVDFKRTHDPLLVGRKAVNVSLSDIAACAGLPRFCLVSLGLAPDVSVTYVRRLTEGTRRACEAFEVTLAGGDVSRASQTVIDVSMYGVVEKRNLALRSGARPGDFIFVTGPLGGAAAGGHLTFTPRIKEARLLSEAVRIHAMCDISDGLAQDLGHIVRSSRVGALIYEELIPLRKEAKGLRDALYSGEDFQLLFTVGRRDAKKLLRANGEYAFPIGEIAGKKRAVTLIASSGKVRVLDEKGFRHF